MLSFKAFSTALCSGTKLELWLGCFCTTGWGEYTWAASGLGRGGQREGEGGRWVLGCVYALKLHAILATTAVAFSVKAALKIIEQHSTALSCVHPGGLTKQPQRQLLLTSNTASSSLRKTPFQAWLSSTSYCNAASFHHLLSEHLGKNQCLVNGMGACKLCCVYNTAWVLYCKHTQTY